MAKKLVPRFTMCVHVLAAIFLLLTVFHLIPQLFLFALVELKDKMIASAANQEMAVIFVNDKRL